MAKKEEMKNACSPCKACKVCMIITAIVLVVLGIWLWNNPTEAGIAKALAIVLVVMGVKKIGHCCPCKAKCCS